MDASERRLDARGEAAWPHVRSLGVFDDPHRGAVLWQIPVTLTGRPNRPRARKDDLVWGVPNSTWARTDRPIAGDRHAEVPVLAKDCCARLPPVGRASLIAGQHHQREGDSCDHDQRRDRGREEPTPPQPPSSALYRGQVRGGHGRPAYPFPQLIHRRAHPASMRLAPSRDGISRCPPRIPSCPRRRRSEGRPRSGARPLPAVSGAGSVWLATRPGPGRDRAPGEPTARLQVAFSALGALRSKPSSSPIQPPMADPSVAASVRAPARMPPALPPPPARDRRTEPARPGTPTRTPIRRAPESARRSARGPIQVPNPSGGVLAR